MLFVVAGLVLALQLNGQNSLSNVQVAQRTDGSQIVDVTYDISGNESFYIVNPEVSFDGGITYHQIDSVAGDIGPFTGNGTGKSFVWYFGKEYPSTFSDQVKIRLSATGGGCGIPLVDNRDGQQYITVGIGGQCWMAENLNYGTMIQSPGQQTDNGIPEKHCYNDEVDSCAVYGGLYQWNELMQYDTLPGSQGICPDGWHVPTIADFGILMDTLGGWNYAGEKIKETGLRYWSSPNPATNESGFSARGAGIYNGVGFGSYKTSTDFFTSNRSANDPDVIYYVSLLYYDIKAKLLNFGSQATGRSVRCIKD